MNAYKTTIKLLVSNGYILKRRGGNHDIFFNPRSKITIPVKRHDFDEDDMRYILKEAGIKLINQQGVDFYDLHVDGSFYACRKQ